MPIDDTYYMFCILTCLFPTDHRQTKNQKEYINRKGIHVVVGHYQGDPPPENLTEGEEHEHEHTHAVHAHCSLVTYTYMACFHYTRYFNGSCRPFIVVM